MAVDNIRVVLKLLSKPDKMCSIERSDVYMYLVNERSKLKSVSRVYEIGETSHSLLDHPRTEHLSTAC